jgi:hypothetical protein
MVTLRGMIVRLEAPKPAYRHIYIACGFDGIWENSTGLPDIRTALPVESGSNCASQPADTLFRLNALTLAHFCGYPAYKP